MEEGRPPAISDSMLPFMMKQTTLGVIFGNRDFFPDHLVGEAADAAHRVAILVDDMSSGNVTIDQR